MPVPLLASFAPTACFFCEEGDAAVLDVDVASREERPAVRGVLPHPGLYEEVALRVKADYLHGKVTAALAQARQVELACHLANSVHGADRVLYRLVHVKVARLAGQEDPFLVLPVAFRDDHQVCPDPVLHAGYPFTEARRQVETRKEDGGGYGD